MHFSLKIMQSCMSCMPDEWVVLLLIAIISVLGSLLIGRTHEELDMLKRKVKQLSGAGLDAEYLSGADLLSMEPALLIGDNCGAAFLPNDCQLDAHSTAAFIQKVNILIFFFLPIHPIKLAYNVVISN